MSQEGPSAAKKPGSSDPGSSTRVAWITAGGTIAAALIGAGAVFLARSGGSGASPVPSPTVSSAVTTTPSQHAASPTPSSTSPSGIITSPPDGTSNVAARKNLQLSGTAQDIPSGYRLDLFLQFGNSGNGTRYYIAADPKSAITLHNGNWAAPIYVGDPGSIIIRLVLLSPSEIAYVDSPSSAAYQENGFPTLPGTTLASANYTAR
jgi:hypothetical protein